MSAPELDRAAKRAARAQVARDQAFEVLAEQVREAVGQGMTEVEAARRAGVDRMTVRRWLGKLPARKIDRGGLPCRGA